MMDDFGDQVDGIPELKEQLVQMDAQLIANLAEPRRWQAYEARVTIDRQKIALHARASDRYGKWAVRDLLEDAKDKLREHIFEGIKDKIDFVQYDDNLMREIIVAARIVVGNIHIIEPQKFTVNPLHIFVGEGRQCMQCGLLDSDKVHLR